MKKLQENSYLFSSNAPFVEERYAAYLQDPFSVSEDWQAFFQDLQANGELPIAEPDHQAIRDEFVRLAKYPRSDTAVQSTSTDTDCIGAKQVAVLQLINAYRFHGHQYAELDSLMLRERELVPELHPAFHKLGEEDMDKVFNTGSLVGAETAPLHEIIETLHRTYCHHIGVEYMHITDTQQKRWLQQRFEGGQMHVEFSPQQRKEILERILAATEFKNICIHATLAKNVFHSKGQNV